MQSLEAKRYSGEPNLADEHHESPYFIGDYAYFHMCGACTSRYCFIDFRPCHRQSSTQFRVGVILRRHTRHAETIANPLILLEIVSISSSAQTARRYAPYGAILSTGARHELDVRLRRAAYARSKTHSIALYCICEMPTT